MLEGNVRQALKLIDADNEVTGVHEMFKRISNKQYLKLDLSKLRIEFKKIITGMCLSELIN